MISYSFEIPLVRQGDQRRKLGIPREGGRVTSLKTAQKTTFWRSSCDSRNFDSIVLTVSLALIPSNSPLILSSQALRSNKPKKMSDPPKGPIPTTPPATAGGATASAAQTVPATAGGAQSPTSAAPTTPATAGRATAPSVGIAPATAGGVTTPTPVAAPITHATAGAATAAGAATGPRALHSATPINTGLFAVQQRPLFAAEGVHVPLQAAHGDDGHEQLTDQGRQQLQAVAQQFDGLLEEISRLAPLAFASEGVQALSETHQQRRRTRRTEHGDHRDITNVSLTDSTLSRPTEESSGHDQSTVELRDADQLRDQWENMRRFSRMGRSSVGDDAAAFTTAPLPREDERDRPLNAHQGDDEEAAPHDAHGAKAGGIRGGVQEVDAARQIDRRLTDNIAAFAANHTNTTREEINREFDPLQAPRGELVVDAQSPPREHRHLQTAVGGGDEDANALADRVQEELRLGEEAGELENQPLDSDDEQEQTQFARMLNRSVAYAQDLEKNALPQNAFRLKPGEILSFDQLKEHVDAFNRQAREISEVLRWGAVRYEWQEETLSADTIHSFLLGLRFGKNRVRELYQAFRTTHIAALDAEKLKAKAMIRKADLLIGTAFENARRYMNKAQVSDRILNDFDIRSYHSAQTGSSIAQLDTSFELRVKLNRIFDEAEILDSKVNMKQVRYEDFEAQKLALYRQEEAIYDEILVDLRMRQERRLQQERQELRHLPPATPAPVQPSMGETGARLKRRLETERPHRTVSETYVDRTTRMLPNIVAQKRRELDEMQNLVDSVDQTIRNRPSSTPAANIPSRIQRREERPPQAPQQRDQAQQRAPLAAAGAGGGGGDEPSSSSSSSVRSRRPPTPPPRPENRPFLSEYGRALSGGGGQPQRRSSVRFAGLPSESQDGETRDQPRESTRRPSNVAGDFLADHARQPRVPMPGTDNFPRHRSHSPFERTELPHTHLYATAGQNDQTMQVMSDCMSKLTNYITSDQDGRKGSKDGSEVKEEFDKQAYYESLPSPWNVQPRTSGRVGDERALIKQYLNGSSGVAKIEPFNGDGSKYFTWRPNVIQVIHKANLTVADKYMQLKLCFKEGTDSTLDVYIENKEASKESYALLIRFVEQTWGGKDRAYLWAETKLLSARRLDPTQLESISYLWAEVQRFVRFCRENALADRLAQLPTVGRILKRLLPEEAIAHMYNMQDRYLLKSSPSTLLLLEEYLEHLSDSKTQQNLVLGRQRQPSKTSQRERESKKPKHRVAFIGNADADDFFEEDSSEEEENAKPESSDSESDDEETKNALTDDELEDYELDESQYDPVTGMTIVYAAIGKNRKLIFPTCKLCEEKKASPKFPRHFLFSCETFKGMSLLDRLTYLKDAKRCFNCMSPKHSVEKCPSSGRCKRCQKKHNSLICKEKGNGESKKPSAKSSKGAHKAKAGK